MTHEAGLLARLAALAAKATAPPWTVSKGSPFCDLRAKETRRGERIDGPLVTFHQHGGSAAAMEEQQANRALIAEVVNNLPALLAASSYSPVGVSRDA
jgi:hypothetical protein